MRGTDFISINDFLFLPFFLTIILVISRLVQKRNIEKYPEYKYYLPGLSLKLLGGISVCLIYTYYYVGGDTLAYFYDGVVMTKFFFLNPKEFFRIIFWGGTLDDRYLFNSDTGSPLLLYDGYAFFVVRFTCILTLIGFRSFLVTTCLLAWISFGGLWRLFRVFIQEFPGDIKQVAIAFFFIPSLFFWGSGLLKDTITTSFMAYFVSSFYMVLIKHKKIFANILIMILSTWIIISIKPYIFVGLLPGLAIWTISAYAHRIKSKLLRSMILPIFLLIIAGFAVLLMSLLGNSLGQYNLDTILVKATETQKDLKRDYYMGNSFDIGTIDPTFSSLITHAHLAIFAAIFRPALIEVNNPVMFFSAIENTFILYITLRILWRLRFFGIFKYFFGYNSMLTFSLIFSLFFAFSVGITTSNFGSLVRYKIPLLPFYVSSVYIITRYKKEETEMQQELKPDEYVYGFR